MSLDVAKSVAKNTSFMMGSQVITWVSSFVLMLFLPRYLGSADYGRLYLAMSVAMLVQILIEFGGPYFITKEVSRSRNTTAHLLVNSIALRILLWAASILILVVFSSVAGYSPTVKTLILILGVSKLWEGARRVLASCFQGFEMMQYPSLGAVVERVFVAAAGVGALLMGADSTGIALIMVASTLLNFLVIIKFTPRIVSSLPPVEWKATAGLIPAGLPYFLWSLFAVAYYRIDAVMLSLLVPETVVGWYGAAYRVFDILMFLPSIFSVAVFPVLSRFGTHDPDRLARTTQKSLECIIIAGIPISIGVFAFAQPFIQFFFGLNEYSQSVPLLQIFAVGLLLVYVDFVLGTALFASDKQRQWTGVAFAALVLNAGLNYALIPSTQTQFGNGGIGSAIATVVTECFVMSVAIVLMPAGLLKALQLAVPLKSLGAGVLMAGSIWLMRTEEIAWVVQGIISLIVYGGALLALKAIAPSEAALIRSLFSVRAVRRALVPQKGTSV
ncbi:MAG: flippase [Candidatus Latescibacteria bacterium]|nr:flippase [Candidatus Latescibacterota bacterium]